FFGGYKNSTIKTKKMIFMFVYNKICTENTVHGNPRRLYVVREVKDGTPYSNLVAVIEEGYRGRARLDELYPGAIELDSYNVPVKEYRRYKNLGKDAGIYYHA